MSRLIVCSFGSEGVEVERFAGSEGFGYAVLLIVHAGFQLLDVRLAVSPRATVIFRWNLIAVKPLREFALEHCIDSRKAGLECLSELNRDRHLTLRLFVFISFKSK